MFIRYGSSTQSTAAERPAGSHFGQKSVRRHPRRAACCFFSLIVLGLIGLIGVAALAKTGLFEIPFFSDIFYPQPPQPERTVTIDQTTSEAISTGLELEVEGRLGHITITEAALTAYLREFTTTGNDPLFAPTVQATIDPSTIILSGLLLKPMRVNITAKIVPVVKAGKVDFTLSDIALGNLSLPPAVADKLLREALAPSLATLAEQVKSIGEVYSIVLATGELTVTGVLADQ